MRVHPPRWLLAGLLGVALGGCVEDLVVGVRQPIITADGGDERDGGQLEVDAAPGSDAGEEPDDASLPDACASPRCGPVLRGPCASCDPVIFVGPERVCDNGAPSLCWDDGNGSCWVQCPDVPSCSDTDDCAEGEYCFYPDLDCGRGSRGVCAPRPSSCEDASLPVCGCDGVAYQSSCQAALVGRAYQAEALKSCP